MELRDRHLDEHGETILARLSREAGFPVVSYIVERELGGTNDS